MAPLSISCCCFPPAHPNRSQKTNGIHLLPLVKGKEEDASPGRPQPRAGCLSPRPAPWSPLGPSTHVLCRHAKGPPVPDQGRRSPDLGGGCPAESLWADPAYAKDLCCDFGQIIPRVAGHSGQEKSRAGSTPYPCDAACPSVKPTQMSLPDRKSTRLNSSHKHRSRMPSSA